MDTRAFIELQYQATKAYLASLAESSEIKEEKFNWEPKLPIGRTKIEHYSKACEMLSAIIENNGSEPSVLFVPASFVPVLIFGMTFEAIDSADHIPGAYGILGRLGSTVVVLDPDLPITGELSMLLVNVVTGQAVRITQGKYDYAADLSALSAEEWQKEQANESDKDASEN